MARETHCNAMHRHPLPPSESDGQTDGHQGSRPLVPGSLSFPPASTLLPCSSSSCNPTCRCSEAGVPHIPTAGTKMGEHPDRKRQPPYTHVHRHTQAGESFTNLSNQQGWLAGSGDMKEKRKKPTKSLEASHARLYLCSAATCYMCAYTALRYPCVQICA